MNINSQRNPSQIRRGLSLIEVVVSTVIVAFILSASLQTVGMVVSTRTRAMQLQLGPSLARSLMNEILAKPYADPDTESSAIGTEIGEGSGNRSAFDDVDDFNGWSTAAPDIPYPSATPIGPGWQRSVSVTFVAPSDMTVSMVDMGLKRITVTATPPAGDATVMEALRSDLGANQRPPHADREIVTGTSVAIELTSGVTAEYSRTVSKNHALDQ